MKLIGEVYCYPYVWDTNEYTKSQMRLWRKLGVQTKSIDYRILKVLPLLSVRRKECAVLNWFEDRINHARFPWLEVIRSLLVLLVIRLSFRRIVWVKHNFQGHDNPRKHLRNFIEFVMGKVSTFKLAHRPLNGFEYIPHPTYDISSLAECERDIPYIYFGVVKPYKGLYELLEKWPIGTPLLIAGKSQSKSLTQQLKQLIADRGLDVEWRNYFIPNEELSGLLVRSQCLVVPHKEDSMIVSGAPFFAMGCGANILVRNGGFGEYLQSCFDGVTLFDMSSLASTLNSRDAVSPKQVRRQLYAVCGDDVLVGYWKRYLEGAA